MRPVEDHTFRTHDGVELFYRYWPAETANPRGAILIFHRGHEHSGRMAHLPDELDLPEFAMFAWDARGHGRSPGARGFSPGLATSVRDVQDFVDHVAATYGIGVETMAVIAQSVGAVLIATWVHDYAPPIRCMVLASPAFKVKLYVPFARGLLSAKYKWRGLFFVNSYVKPQFLTHDPARSASYRADPLITRPIAVNILLDLYRAAERVVSDARAITVPTQLLISGADWVVHHPPQHRFFERLGTPVKERHVLPGFFHDTMGEQDRSIAIEKARRFILARFAEKLNRPSLLEADRSGYTRDEADESGFPFAACLGARPVLGGHAARPEAGRAGVGRHTPRPPHRVRFRFDARLCLPQPARRARAGRAADRRGLSRFYRLVRHPPAQAACRGAVAPGDAAPAG